MKRNFLSINHLIQTKKALFLYHFIRQLPITWKGKDEGTREKSHSLWMLAGRFIRAPCPKPRPHKSHD